MKHRLGNRGFIKGVFYIVIIGLLIFIGISFGMPYYRYNILKSYAENHMKTEIGNTEKIKERVMAAADELHVPLNEENLSVMLNEYSVELNAHWSEVVDFFGLYQKEVPFSFTINMDY